MFSLFAPPIVDFVESDQHDRIVVRCHRRFTLGQEHKIRIRFKPGDNSPLYTYRVFSIWDRPAPPIHGSGWTCCFSLVKPKTLPEFEPMDSGRRHDRLEGRFRTVSRQLPEYTAVTVDISESGIQLNTRGPLALGTLIDLRIEPEMSDWQALTFKARVSWCKEEGRTFFMGLEYVEVEEEARERLRELATFLAAARDADIRTRSLSGADYLLQNKKPPQEP